MYLKNICSFKAELNLLNQQNPETFVIKMDKMKVDSTNLWKVKGDLLVRYKGIETPYDCVEQNVNSKVAEEMVAKKVVEIVYDNYIDIFQKMVLIKNKKSIKT
jgi:hypothetical protein